MITVDLIGEETEMVSRPPVAGPSRAELIAVALMCLLTPPILLFAYCGGPEWVGRILEGR